MKLSRSVLGVDETDRDPGPGGASPARGPDLAAAAQTDAQRVELYTASRLAVDVDTRAERGYLNMLAGRLKLPDALVDHIEATVASANR